jgi:hypothetical protein
MPPIAIWVELIGKPNCEATITVNAAAMATQNARIWSRSVISPPTVRMSLGPYSARPSAMPAAKIKGGVKSVLMACLVFYILLERSRITRRMISKNHHPRSKTITNRR